MEVQRHQHRDAVRREIAVQVCGVVVGIHMEHSEQAGRGELLALRAVAVVEFPLRQTETGMDHVRRLHQKIAERVVLGGLRGRGHAQQADRGEKEAVEKGHGTQRNDGRPAVAGKK